MIRIIRSAGMKEGRWLNGMGVSWDIAAEPPDAGPSDFGWRFAIARIDADVPFSHYAGVDRVFTLIAGRGLALDVAGLGNIDVAERFVPQHFPGDAATACRLKDGPCRALNLFMARDKWRAEVEVARGAKALSHDGPVLIFALDGEMTCNGEKLDQGDAAVACGELHIAPNTTMHYTARLSLRR